MEGTWIREPQGNSAVVFLHGVLSSGDTCWTHKNGIFWPEILADEQEIATLGIYVFTYKTGIFSGTYSLGDVVDSLKEFMRLDGVIACKNLIFVCHSMGGIVARRYIVQRANELKENGSELGLFLLASPSLGADYANWLSPLARFFGHTQADALRFSQGNTWLMDLDRDFQNLKEGGVVSLFGKELIEDNFVVLKRFWRKQVVEPFSGAKNFGDPYKVPNSDHFSIAKVESKNSIQHRLLLKFIQDFWASIERSSSGASAKLVRSSEAVGQDITHDKFSAKTIPQENDGTLLCRVLLNQKPLSFRETLDLWVTDVEFIEFFQSLFLKSGFAGYVWELPPLTSSALERQFEFVIHRTPSSSATADQQTYAEYFEKAEHRDDVLTFDNLGGDALLVVPCPYRDGIDYSGVRQFLENAPIKQQRQLWKLVATKVLSRLSDTPIWVSVAGGGVPWLHVRLDSSPKYYRHQLYTSGNYVTPEFNGGDRGYPQSGDESNLKQSATAGDGATIIQVGGDFKS